MAKSPRHVRSHSTDVGLEGGGGGVVEAGRCGGGGEGGAGRERKQRSLGRSKERRSEKHRYFLAKKPEDLVLIWDHAAGVAGREG